jgi:hypothetical protein
MKSGLVESGTLPVLDSFFFQRDFSGELGGKRAKETPRDFTGPLAAVLCGSF